MSSWWRLEYANCIPCIGLRPAKQMVFGYDFKMYLIGMMVRVFAKGLGDPGRVISKTQKMVLDASLLNIQHYKVRIKGKVEQSRERSSANPYSLM